MDRVVALVQSLLNRVLGQLLQGIHAFYFSLFFSFASYFSLLNSLIIQSLLNGHLLQVTHALILMRFVHLKTILPSFHFNCHNSIFVDQID